MATNSFRHELDHVHCRDLNAPLLHSCKRALTIKPLSTTPHKCHRIRSGHNHICTIHPCTRPYLLPCLLQNRSSKPLVVNHLYIGRYALFVHFRVTASRYYHAFPRHRIPVGAWFHYRDGIRFHHAVYHACMVPTSRFSLYKTDDAIHEYFPRRTLWNQKERHF